MESVQKKLSWSEASRSYLKPQVLRMLFLGFSAGLPLALIFGTLSLWLNEAGVDKSTVTFFSWAALGYSFKFIWAPLVDKLPLPFVTRALGRRRGWLLFAQLGIISAICIMANINPGTGEEIHLTMIAMGAVMLGFSSATQDIVIDAYRIETGTVKLQPMMSSMYMAGYRVGMIVAGAGALYLASYWGSTADAYQYNAWRNTYLTMAACALVGVVTTLVIREPDKIVTESHYTNQDYLRFFALFLFAAIAFVLFFLKTSSISQEATSTLSAWFANDVLASVVVEGIRLICAGTVALVITWLLLKAGAANKEMVKEAYIAPITDFFNRYSLKTAVILLLLIGFYRISDIVMGVIANIFYQDMGYSKVEIANASKAFGFLMIIVGGFLGGVLALRIGVMRLLFVGALLASATNVLFMLLAEAGYSPWMLYFVIAADNLSGGIALSAFIAFLSGLTSVSFTAMQYAIFSSLMTLLPKILGGYSGAISTVVGYSNFFMITALLGLPVLLLVWLASRHLSIDGRIKEE
ncbi:MFS transporter [Porticoccaceae bacterium LTM1]|nr:MFS transporter [Porticoccaceae bacterium LTM1]